MNTITDRDNGARALLARLEAQRDARVRVGVLDDVAKRTEAGEGPLSLLEVATVHEFGAGDIPQRSFIRATVDLREAEIHQLQRGLSVQILRGDVTQEVALERLGAKVAAMCQNRISQGIEPPNTPETIERKGSSKPLVDTGQLKAAITFRVYREG